MIKWYYAMATLESKATAITHTHTYIYIYIYIYIYTQVHWPGGSVRQWPNRPAFNPKSSHMKIVLDTPLFNTQHYKVGIKAEV